jgi:hypothetical protein
MLKQIREEIRVDVGIETLSCQPSLGIQGMIPTHLDEHVAVIDKARQAIRAWPVSRSRTDVLSRA